MALGNQQFGPEFRPIVDQCQRSRASVDAALRSIGKIPNKAKQTPENLEAVVAVFEEVCEREAWAYGKAEETADARWASVAAKYSDQKAQIIGRLQDIQARMDATAQQSVDRQLQLASTHQYNQQLLALREKELDLRMKILFQEVGLRDADTDPETAKRQAIEARLRMLNGPTDVTSAKIDHPQA